MKGVTTEAKAPKWVGKQQSAYNAIYDEVKDRYRKGTAALFQGYPDNLRGIAVERFHERYLAHNEINPFTGKPRVIGLEDANWIVDVAAGGIPGLVKKVGTFTVARSLSTLATEESLLLYRAMSNVEYAALEANNGLTYKKGTELFVSNQASYSRNYLLDPKYDVLVEFKMKPGTMDLLKSKAAYHRASLVRRGGPIEALFFLKRRVML